MEPVSAGTVSKAQAQNNNGQASPALFQNRASENEQDFYSPVRPISGDSNPIAADSSDRKNEVNHDQNTNTNPDTGGNPCDSRIDHNPGSSNRADDEVKNANRIQGENGLLANDFLASSESMESFKIAPSARLSAPANQASFDAGKITLPHVRNEPSDDQSATCGKFEPNMAKQSTSQSREVLAFNPSIFTVDVITASKNRWKIRIRCRKQNCEHSDHLKIKTVSLISDSVYKKLIRSKRSYELWKKQILVENAPALRKS